MERAEAAAHVIEKIRTKGVEKAQVLATHLNRQELQTEHGPINMLRSMENMGVKIKAIAGQKLGTAFDNCTEPAALDALCDKAVTMAEGSPPDPAYDIAPAETISPGENRFNRGPLCPDLEGVYTRLRDALGMIREKYPQLKMDHGGVQHIVESATFLNSNGVQWEYQSGHYEVFFMFLAKEGKKVSSLNSAAYSFTQLDGPLLEGTPFEALLQETVEQLHVRPVTGKFIGDVIISPHCLWDFVQFLSQLFLSDLFIVSNRGLLKDKLNQTIASPAFSLRSMPVGHGMAKPQFITDDGLKAQEATIIDRGVLRSFMLSLYGANKSGHQHFAGVPGNFVVDAGKVALADQIKSVERGILLNRYAGSAPDDRGDFSGVAKNSYYIEDGKVQYPLQETTVSGNLASLLAGVLSTSSESINFGYSIFPWLHTRGMTISGGSNTSQ